MSYTKLPEGTPTPKHFESIMIYANGKKVKENLDTFNELQQFAQKRIEDGAMFQVVTSFDQEGRRKQIMYLRSDNGFLHWEKMVVTEFRNDNK